MSDLRARHANARCLFTEDKVLEEESRHLWFITAISNPVRYISRYNLYHKFRDHVKNELGANLITVEGILGHHDSFIPDDTDEDERNKVVRVYSHSWIWLKENLMNIGVSHVPSDCKYLVFCDADVRFVNHRTVLQDIASALQTYDIIQPFESVIDLGANDEVMELHRSFASCLRKGGVFDGGSLYSKTPEGMGNAWHPGYVVACTSTFFHKIGGLCERAILGAGDHHLMCALVNKVHLSVPSGIHPSYSSMLQRYQTAIQKALTRGLGFVPGTILHSWHGPKQARQYVSRWNILTRNQFDPDADVYKNGNGVLELSDDKPELRHDIIAYFKSRNEDDLG
jgi:hypothetical protein